MLRRKRVSRRALLSALVSAGIAALLPRGVQAKTRHAKADDASLVNVTFTGFRQLPDGRSQVYVELTDKVPVRVERKPGVAIYELSGARVTLRNNRNPLITTGFLSSLESARLLEPRSQRSGRGKRKSAAAPTSVQLVLRLRAEVEPSYKFSESASGAVLEVTLPPLPGR